MQASQLELNVMMPLIAHNLLFSMEILGNAVDVFSSRCIQGLKADRKKCRELAESTLAMATALNPVIGYSEAAKISQEAYRTGRTVKEVAIEKGILSRTEADRILDPRYLTGK